MPKLMLFIMELIILYGTAAVGFTAKKCKIINQDADYTLTQIILYITLPSLILYSMDFSFSYELIKDFIYLIVLSIYALSVAAVFAYAFSKKSNYSPDKTGIYENLIIFGNQGFLGYAICQSLLGKEGIMYAAIFNIPYLFLIWTYGIYLTANIIKFFSWKSLILNPGVLSTVTGLIILFIPLQYPYPLLKFLQNLGTPTTPLSMLLIGSLLANLNKEQIVNMLKDINLYKISFIKLILTPTLLLPLMLCGLKNILLTIAILITAMPCAPTIPIFAKKYGKDAYLGSAGVCISTLLSTISLPIIYGIINLFT